MQVSHVVYKVNNLAQSVHDFKKKGFAVEYGTKTNPHNALIYFSKGPYIELLEHAPLPYYLKVLLKLMGNGKTIERLEQWKNAKEGLIDLCLENYTTNFEQEEAILKKYQQKYFITKSKRLDPKGRLLKWKLLFPNELNLPFLMTYFNIDPKPKNFIHPNGIKRIKKVTYGTNKTLIPIINELCNDKLLHIEIGTGLYDLTYE